MMKKIFFYIAAFALVSCSSDDDSKGGIDNGGNIPAGEKLLKNFNFGNTSMPIEFEYNENKTVKRMNIANAYLLDFKYSGENVTSINAIAEGTSAVFEFSYDVNNHINGFTINGEEVIVEYDPVANSYLYYEQDDDDRTTVFLSEAGDMERFKLEDGNNGNDKNFLYVYSEDADKKGPMANTNNIHVYLGMILPELYIYIPFIASKPVEIVSFSEGTFQCTNSFYDDGFVEQTSIIISGSDQQDSFSSLNYKYTQL